MYKTVRRVTMYSEYIPKKIKQKRIFYLSEPACQRNFFIWSGVTVLFVLIAIGSADLSAKATAISLIIFPIVAVICVTAVIIANKPKEFEILGDRIEYSTYKRLIISSPSRRKGYFPRVKVHYTITDVKIASLCQTPLEKLFDIGRITFTGKITFTSNKYLDKIPPCNCFPAYGIKNFSTARTVIEDQIKNARKDSYYD